MKAVIWTDLFQSVVMIASVLLIVIKGLVDLDGFSNLWYIADKGGRLNLFNFNPDPFERLNFWSLYIGGVVYCKYKNLN